MLGEEAEGWNGKHERSEGLHKRSAEDCGKPLAPRQGSALSEAWFPYACASAHMIYRVGVAGGKGPLWWEAENAKRSQRGRSRPPEKAGMQIVAGFAFASGLPTSGRCPKIGMGRARTVLGFGNPFDTKHAARRVEGFPTTLCVGELVTNVQAPKAKGHRSRVSTAFQLPDQGLWACLRGRTADLFAHPEVEEYADSACPYQLYRSSSLRQSEPLCTSQSVCPDFLLPESKDGGRWVQCVS